MQKKGRETSRGGCCVLECGPELGWLGWGWMQEVGKSWRSVHESRRCGVEEEVGVGARVRVRVRAS